MATVYPLRCFRPARHFANKFVRKPSDFSSLEKEEVLEKLLANSVFSISQPELFGYTFEEGKDKFGRFLREGYIYPEVRPAFYVYEIKDEKKSRLGLVCNQNISDIDAGRLLLHEKTKAKNAEFLEKRLTNLKLNFTPVFSIAPDQENLFKKILTKAIQNVKADITISLSNEKHRVYKLSDPAMTNAVRNAIQSMPEIYLADGHHRLSVLKKQGKEQFSTVVFPQSDVSLYSYAKIIREVPLQLVQQFETELLKNEFLTDKNKGEEIMELYMNQKWKKFYSQYNQVDCMWKLGNFITEYFKLNDTENDERILFLKDLYGKQSIAKFMENMNARLAIRFPPLAVEDIFHAAKKDKNLPAKSTLFHPKPRAGLFITRM